MRPRKHTVRLRHQLEARLGPHAPFYWRAFRDYVLQRLSRAAFEERIKHLLAQRPIRTRHNRLLMAMLYNTLPDVAPPPPPPPAPAATAGHSGSSSGGGGGGGGSGGLLPSVPGHPHLILPPNHQVAVAKAVARARQARHQAAHAAAVVHHVRFNARISALATTTATTPSAAGATGTDAARAEGTGPTVAAATDAAPPDAAATSGGMRLITTDLTTRRDRTPTTAADWAAYRQAQIAALTPEERRQLVALGARHASAARQRTTPSALPGQTMITPPEHLMLASRPPVTPRGPLAAAAAATAAAAVEAASVEGGVPPDCQTLGDLFSPAALHARVLFCARLAGTPEVTDDAVALIGDAVDLYIKDIIHTTLRNTTPLDALGYPLEGPPPDALAAAAAAAGLPPSAIAPGAGHPPSVSATAALPSTGAGGSPCPPGAVARSQSTDALSALGAPVAGAASVAGPAAGPTPAAAAPRILPLTLADFQFAFDLDPQKLAPTAIDLALRERVTARLEA
ncbi:hypothetical protein CXG81DRAFT_16363 [Caulochytrium protostelioides]|uniref:Uncharacterized protein n=1 Tax=Caulochytrium protostelioides TaxID=1555241 RepID=A0A4P9XF75_9FUNG|nr:hypothetical protein CXG81DRAFT_16363 [Caulochytrium protostelioides]|eukprot:RKP04233.1 hypothetical protein CXG81DRAFT_16363 [Caulochytrium protostelioides]